jgi:hypothetical protein
VASAKCYVASAERYAASAKPYVSSAKCYVSSATRCAASANRCAAPPFQHVSLSEFQLFPKNLEPRTRHATAISKTVAKQDITRVEKGGTPLRENTSKKILLSGSDDMHYRGSAKRNEDT